MFLKGNAVFTAAKRGKKKDGTDYFMLKFLDNDCDEFFRTFVDEDLFGQMLSVPKGVNVSLTFNLVPGQTYFVLENLEIVGK